jgi:hypothetical protein
MAKLCAVIDDTPYKPRKHATTPSNQSIDGDVAKLNKLASNRLDSASPSARCYEQLSSASPATIDLYVDLIVDG